MHFVARENGPERLVTEAEIQFDEGPLAGMRLVGFSLWRSPEGEIYVTFIGVSGQPHPVPAVNTRRPPDPAVEPLSVWSLARKPLSLARYRREGRRPVEPTLEECLCVGAIA